MEHQPSVTWNEELSRYDVHVDGELAGFTDVTVAGDVATFTHLELSDDFQGRGIAAVLAGDAVADAVARNLRIVPRCPYVKKYLRKHEVPGAQVEWPQG